MECFEWDQECCVLANEGEKAIFMFDKKDLSANKEIIDFVNCVQLGS